MKGAGEMLRLQEMRWSVSQMEARGVQRGAQLVFAARQMRNRKGQGTMETRQSKKTGRLCSLRVSRVSSLPHFQQAAGRAESQSKDEQDTENWIERDPPQS